MHEAEMKKIFANWKFWKIFLIVVSVLATMKVIFFDYTLDEEYQLMMSYRNLNGDALFQTMWEPHQTSAFMNTGLLWLYEAVTGTYTGALLFIRFVTAGIQTALAFYVYKILKPLLKPEYAYVLAVIYFNMSPKLIQIPEFGNMQHWFFTLLVLFAMEYVSRMQKGTNGAYIFLLLSGVAMALEVLSYPSSIILFPFFMAYYFLCSPAGWKRKAGSLAAFVLPCAGLAFIWFAIVLPGMTVDEFIRNFVNTMSFDLTHEVSGVTGGKWQGLGQNLLYGGICVAGICAAAYLVTLLLSGVIKGKEIKSKEAKRNSAKENEIKDVTAKGNKVSNQEENKQPDKTLIFCTLTVLFAGAVQVFIWMVLRKGYEFPQIHLPVILIVFWCLWKKADEKKKMFLPGIIAAYLNILAVFYLSDLQLYHAFQHGLLGVLFAVIVIVIAMEKVWKKAGRQRILCFLMFLCAVTLVGKSFTFRSGRELTMPWEVRGITKHGIAAGVLTDYMFAYIYNSNYEDWNAYVKDGDRVLVVTNMLFSAGTTPYTFQDVDICHYSIVDPTAYDERLLAYWELYPEKQPDVIVVDCWYGELKEDPENWIMQYIEKDFGYTEYHDGKYVRFYRR